MNLECLAKVKNVILLEGESGTGKSYTAKKIHQLSYSNDRPFIAVNLATISETLLESELFGYKKGSFTGADKDKKGYLDLVNGGTLFLDEVGELSLLGQQKLLRLLEERSYTSVGDTQVKSFKGRIILATNKDLLKEVEKGHFRKDLYYRIRIFTYYIKPIRERIDELEFIIEDEFNNAKIAYEKYYLNLTEDHKNLLLCHSWEGNYREIKNTMEYIVAASNDRVTLSSFPHWICTDLDHFVKESDYHNALHVFEKHYLTVALNRYQGKINLTSDMIGLNKVTLLGKIKKYNRDVKKIKSIQRLAAKEEYRNVV